MSDTLKDLRAGLDSAEPVRLADAALRSAGRLPVEAAEKAVEG